VNVGGGEILQKDKNWRQTENTYYVMRKTCRILHKYDHRWQLWCKMLARLHSCIAMAVNTFCTYQPLSRIGQSAWCVVASG